MRDSVDSLTELNYLWKRRGNKNYNLVSLVSGGNFTRYMLFEDRQNNRRALGKIVTSPREGEAYHWPRLLHENLAPLQEIVSINEATSVYIFQWVGNSLRNVIHDDNFRYDPACFDRKKAYAGDILWALDYLHQRSLCIMNLTETIIYISDVADKAVICDFSCVVLIQRACKENIQLPILYQAPELDSGYFQPVQAEMWSCGVILLQVFTQHHLPSAFIGDEVHPILKSVAEINCDIMREANPGSSLCESDIVNLKSFLGLFLAENPSQRADAQLAAISSFLRLSKRKSEIDCLGNFLDESNPNEFCSFKTTSSREHDCFKRSITFKDIYLKEAAMYKDKLRQSPSTNKFINMEYVSNYLEEKNSVQKLFHGKASKRDVTSAKTHETFRDAVLSTKNNSKESVISKRKANPEVIQNEFYLHSKPVEVNINFELPQNNSEDVIDSTFPNWHRCECYLNAERLCEDVIDNYNNQFTPRDDFVSNKSKHNESTYGTDISTDSLDTLEHKENNSLQKLELNSHTDKIKSNLHKKENKLYLRSQNDIEFSKCHPEANLYSVKSESSMKTFCTRKTDFTSIRSDSCLVDFSIEKRNEIKSESSASTLLCSNPDADNSRQTMILSSSNLYKEAGSETERYKKKCHRNSHLKEDAHHHMFHTNTPTSNIDSILLHRKSEDIQDILLQNSNNSSKQQYLLKDEYVQRDDACNQHEVDNVTFALRRNSYEQAISNGLEDTSESNPSKQTDTELPSQNKIKKTHPKSLFRKREPIPVKIQTKSCCSPASIQNIQDFSGCKSDPSHMNVFVGSDLGSMETTLLNKSERESTSKKAKKNWIHRLCLGAKT